MVEEKLQATLKYWTVMFTRVSWQFLDISTNFFSPRQKLSVNIVLSLTSIKKNWEKAFKHF